MYDKIHSIHSLFRLLIDLNFKITTLKFLRKVKVGDIKTNTGFNSKEISYHLEVLFGNLGS